MNALSNLHFCLSIPTDISTGVMSLTTDLISLKEIYRWIVWKHESIGYPFGEFPHHPS